MGRTRRTPLLEAFGARVRELRRDRDWTQEELAERAGIHWTYLGTLERGQRNVSLRNIARLAAALGVDPCELVRGLPPDDPGGGPPA